MDLIHNCNFQKMADFMVTLLFFLCGSTLIVQGARPGETCSPVDSNLFCSDPFTQCVEDNWGDFECQCNSEYFLDRPNFKCIKFPQYPDDKCDNNLAPCDGIPNTDCINAVCACIPDYKHDNVNRRCLKDPQFPGDICEKSSVPCDSTVPPTVCGNIRSELDESVCECLSVDEVTDIINKRCLIKPQLPGDSCTSNLTPCTTVRNTTCSPDFNGDLTCQCIPDLVTNPNQGLCLINPSKPGDSCDQKYTPCQFVQEQTTCEPSGAGFMCTCTGNKITDYITGRCLTPPKFPGDLCDPQWTPCESAVPNTICVSDSSGNSYYCKCQGEFATDIGNKRCLPIPKKPGDECNPHIAPCTTVPNTFCDGDFTCTCNSPWITDKVHGRCLINPEQVGDPCDTILAPCTYVPRTECFNDIACQCLPEFVPYPTNKTCLSMPILPGDPCDPVLLPCDSVPGASTCASKPDGSFYCKCDGNLINDPANRRCLDLPKDPLDICHPVVAQCTTVDHTQCSLEAGGSEFRCFCNSGFVHDAKSKRCILPPLSPGDNCEPTLAPCNSVTNTTCNWDDALGYFCQCLPDLVQEIGKCFSEPTLPGDQCSILLADCKNVPYTTCRPKEDGSNTYYCKCDGSLVNDPDFRRCLTQPKEPMDPCHPSVAPCPDIEKTECTINNDSTGYQCFCKAELVYDGVGKRCITEPTLPGDQCEPVLAPCSGINNTSCTFDPVQGHTCHCTGDLITGQGRCFRRPTKPGQECNPSIVNCSGVTNTTCVLNPGQTENFYCQCIEGFFTDFDKEQCVPLPTKPGEPCQPAGIIDICSSVNNSECVPVESGYICKCLPDYFQSSNDSCKPLPLKPMEPCEEEVHCTNVTGTFCNFFNNSNNTDGNCLCIAEEWDLSLDHDKCIHKAEMLYSECETIDQCSKLNNTYCNPITSICTCLPNTMPSNSLKYCLSPVTLIGFSCLEDSQCLNGIGLGSDCDDDEGICVCVSGFVDSSDQKKCLQISSPGSDCLDSQQCRPTYGDHSVCDPLTKLCNCTQDAVLFDNWCEYKASLGSLCNSTAACILGSNEYAICDSFDKKCVCDPEFSFEQNGLCIGNIGLGSSCQSDQECELSGDRLLVCDPKDNVCKCGFLSHPEPVGNATEDKLMCVSDRSIGPRFLVNTNVLIVLVVTMFFVF